MLDKLSLNMSSSENKDFIIIIIIIMIIIKCAIRLNSGLSWPASWE